MEGHDVRSADGSPIFDTFDIDLIVKVLAHTAFSPFFLCFIPIFYIFQGARFTDSVVLWSGGYYIAVSLFWFVKWCSRLYRNQGSLISGPGQFDWGEQIVVITGGASGIGELLANTLAVRNINVIVLDVNPIITENYNITYFKCDVSKFEEVEAVSKRIVEEIGEPTVLVNNAGVVHGKSLLDLSPDDIKQTFEINTLAHFWTLKAFLPAMLKKKSGHIVTISSVIGVVGSARMCDYSASKAALNSLNESLRYELDHCHKCPQIRTTLVVAGHVLTPMFSAIRLPPFALHRFFFPSIPPITIIKRIISALDEQHSQVIMVPFFVHFAPFLTHLPSFVKDLAQKVTGADYAMRDFVKTSGLRENETISQKTE